MRKHKIAIALCMLPFSFALAQEVVKGKVISTNKKPLQGVTVTVSETGTTTTTDKNGEYEIKNTEKGNTLIFSLTDYEGTELKVNNSVINVTLTSMKEKSIDEVVMIGYTRQKKADITGAISVVDMKDINNRPNPIL